MSESHRRRSPLKAAIIASCLLALLLSPGCSSNKENRDEQQSGLMKVTFSVPDMCCTSCAMKTKIALENFPGVKKAYANFLEKEAWARYDPTMVEVEQLQRSIKILGFKEVTIVSNAPYVPEPIAVPG